MNDYSSQLEPSQDVITTPMNLTLIRMQIQGFTESLRRLETQNGLSQIELGENESNDSRLRKNC